MFPIGLRVVIVVRTGNLNIRNIKHQTTKDQRSKIKDTTKNKDEK
jgi:hypothetical protein